MHTKPENVGEETNEDMAFKHKNMKLKRMI